MVTIAGESFLINAVPTYQGLRYHGSSLEGLLLNSRMVQGVFDDENPATRVLWRYPDADDYDAERNTREFVAAMPLWREHGLLAITVCLQGGGPIYTKPYPYHEYINSAYGPDGALKPAYMTRLEAILDRAAELEMAVILGLAYFGIDHRYLESPEAVRAMTDNVVDWLAERDCRHVLIEVANEATVIRSRSGAVSTLELMERIRARSREKYPDDFALLCSTSLGGGKLHDDAHMGAMDFILVHGNGCDAGRHLEMIQQIRAHPAFEANPRPIVFNEAHTDVNCLRVCAGNRASWGYFDQGRNDYENGYQTPPVNWGINTDRKRDFFAKMKEITGQ